MARLPLQASDELQKELRKISITERLTSSSLLFAQGDPAKGVYLVESGSVGLMLDLRRGKTVFQRKLGKGSLLGLPATMNDTAYSLTARVLSDADLAFIPRDKLLEAMNRNVFLAIEILKVLSEEVQAMRDVIRTKCRGGGSPRKSVRERVVDQEL